VAAGVFVLGFGCNREHVDRIHMGLMQFGRTLLDPLLEGLRIMLQLGRLLEQGIAHLQDQVVLFLEGGFGRLLL